MISFKFHMWLYTDSSFWQQIIYSPLLLLRFDIWEKHIGILLFGPFFLKQLVQIYGLQSTSFACLQNNIF